jgi:hypothetical protein
LTLHRQFAVRGRRLRIVGGPVLACIALFVGSVSGAQQVEVTDPHRWAATIALDGGTLPDEFVTRCGFGSDPTPSLGAGLGLLFRPGRWLVAGADTRLSISPVGLGCKLTIPAPVRIGPNEYENYSPKGYPNGAPADPLVRSALHIGVETPPGSPLLRATVGIGVTWASDRTPFGTVAIGGGSRGRGARFYWGLETSVCRVNVTETHTRFRSDSNTMTPLPSRIVSYVDHPRWTMLHLGMEFPLALRH